MYFILSKVLLFLLFPLNWIIFSLSIALFSKKSKLKRRSFITAVLLLVVFTNPCLLYLFAKGWDIGPAPLTKGKVYSAVIVLGGFAGEDKNGGGVFNGSADRFMQGLRLKEQGRVSHILISSGNGNLQQDNFKEAAWAQGVLKEFNLPDSAVLIEQESRNTFENAVFSKELLAKTHLPPPYLLVTSAWHMRRAFFIFKKAGMDVIPCPSGHITGDSKLSAGDYVMPDAGVLAEWNMYLKEGVGLLVAHLK